MEAKRPECVQSNANHNAARKTSDESIARAREIARLNSVLAL